MYKYHATLTQTGEDEELEIMMSSTPVSVKDVIVINGKRYMVFEIAHENNGNSFIMADAMDVI